MLEGEEAGPAQKQGKLSEQSIIITANASIHGAFSRTTTKILRRERGAHCFELIFRGVPLLIRRGDGEEEHNLSAGRH